MVRHNTIMDKENATRRAHDLMTTAEAVYLTTLDPDGWPNTRAMLNLRNTERYPGLVPVFTSYDLDCTLLFTTNTSSGKVSQITGNPRASAYFCNPSEWRGLMLGGEISVVADLNLKEGIWQENWRMLLPGRDRRSGLFNLTNDTTNSKVLRIPGLILLEPGCQMTRTLSEGGMLIAQVHQLAGRVFGRETS